MIRLVVASTAVLIAACSENPRDINPPGAQRTAQSAPTIRLPYRLDAPEAVFSLPDELEEASALTVLPSGNLATLEDESGVVYELDPETGAIVRRTPFEGPGDFEGIEWAKDALWALRSDGTLFKLVGDAPVEAYETPLTVDYDTEGLAWDPQRQRLLIACKDDAGEGIDDARSVYAFDPVSIELDPNPVILLQREAVDSDDDFRPSALAVHPVTGETYILSSRRRAIAVVAPDGHLVGVADLPVGRNAQPEGIAFLPDGTMFIENEAGEGPATVQRFTMGRE